MTRAPTRSVHRAYELAGATVVSKVPESTVNTKAGRLQVERVSRQILMSNINIEEIRGIVIPLPSLETQLQLADRLDSAREERDARLNEAEGLLSSVDLLLFENLGISIPDSAKSSSVFGVRLREARHRFDVSYLSPYFRGIRQGIEQCGFPVASLGDICPSIKTGFAAGRSEQAAGSDGIPHLRPNNVTPFGEVDVENVKRVPRKAVEQSDFLCDGEVLLNNTYSSKWIGKSAVFRGEIECCCSNHMTRLCLDRDIVDPMYLSATLNSLRSIGYFTYLATNFVNQSGVNTRTLEEVRIPLPGLELQRSIAGEIRRRRERANTIRRDASAKWHKAKASFEASLLGRHGDS